MFPTATLTGSGGGGVPTWKMLRTPPSSPTACTLARRSRRMVGSVLVGSTLSGSLRLESPILGCPVGWRRLAAFWGAEGAMTAAAGSAAGRGADDGGASDDELSQ